jgi:hypothetical protein
LFRRLLASSRTSASSCSPTRFIDLRVWFTLCSESSSSSICARAAGLMGAGSPEAVLRILSTTLSSPCWEPNLYRPWGMAGRPGRLLGFF